MWCVSCIDKVQRPTSHAISLNQSLQLHSRSFSQYTQITNRQFPCNMRISKCSIPMKQLEIHKKKGNLLESLQPTLLSRPFNPPATRWQRSNPTWSLSPRERSRCKVLSYRTATRQERLVMRVWWEPERAMRTAEAKLRSPTTLRAFILKTYMNKTQGSTQGSAVWTLGDDSKDWPRTWGCVFLDFFVVLCPIAALKVVILDTTMKGNVTWETKAPIDRKQRTWNKTNDRKPFIMKEYMP